MIDARKAKGLTQIELAKKLGKAQSFVSYYEKGVRRIDVVELLQICKILGIDPAKVMGLIADDR